MSVKEIETAIAQLDHQELVELAAWFEEYHGRLWDEQIAADYRAGRLDRLIQEANQEFEAGRVRPL